MTGASDEILKTIVDMYPSVKEYFIDLINNDSSPEILLACQRLIRFFGQQNKTFYKDLLAIINEQDINEGFRNGNVEDFLKNRLREVNDYADKPVWVKDFTNGSIGRNRRILNENVSVGKLEENLSNLSLGFEPIPSISGEAEVEDAKALIDAMISGDSSQYIKGKYNEENSVNAPISPNDLLNKGISVNDESTLPYDELILPHLPSGKYQLPSDEEAVRLLTNGLLEFGISIADARKSADILREQYTLLSVEEKLTLLLPVFKNRELYNLSSNLDLFRILGPCNPFAGSVLSQGISFEDKWGGPRLFTSVDFENYTEEDGLLETEENIDWFTGSCSMCNLKIYKRCYAFRRALPNGGFQSCYCSPKCARDSIGDNDTAMFAMVDEIERQLMTFGIQDRRYR